MSTDDIVFEEVKYREPKKARRPDRDRRWTCMAYEVLKVDDLPIFLDRKTADAMERHALRDTSVELGGIMLGHECVDDQTGEPFVWVTECLEAKHYENTQASFTYTHDSWEEITRERDKLHPDLDIVGWYHTHPDFGIFLSSHDLFIHRNFFDQPLQVAYVIDPIRQTRGFFRWKNGGLEQVGGYYVSAERGDRVALARLVNDLESLPNPEGSGGGGFSPQLEAKLIDMLSRPHQVQSSAADRAQVAALSGMLGLFGGVIIVAAVAWLYTLSQQMRDQTDALIRLDKSVEQTEKVQSWALDALLSKTEEAGNPRKFIENYQKANKELDEFKAKAKDKDKLVELAIADNTKLAKEIDELKKKTAEALEKARTERENYETQREKTKDLQSEMDAYLKTPQGELNSKYSSTLYAAIAGWVVALLSSLGVLFFWLSKTPPDQEMTMPSSLTVPIPGVSPGQPPSQEPPHQIV